jgi:hexokinase
MADVPNDLLAQIEELERIFTVDQTKLKEIMHHFVSELKKGLSKEGGNIVSCAVAVSAVHRITSDHV